MRSFFKKTFFILGAFVLPWAAIASNRFPQPQFDSGHHVPQAVHPAFVELVPAWADVLILGLALALTVWLVHGVRSRRWVLFFSMVCLAWFGFVRQGCICPVGAVQNVAVAVCSGGGLPWFVAALFALPLLTALLFGRVFCGAVCPLGILQDLFIVKPQRVPAMLDAVLRLIPLMVLSVGVVASVNGAGFLICRTDPFVGFFRRSAPLALLLGGMAVLLIGMVIARPYCRYFCPYGVLLEFCARLAWRPVVVTPETCINCRLCVGTCPVDAIAVPREAPNSVARTRQFRSFVTLLALSPLLLAAWGTAGWLSGVALAQAHPVVQVFERVKNVPEAQQDLYPEVEAFKRSGLSREALTVQVSKTIRRFQMGSALAGFFIGLVMIWRLLELTRLRRREYHEVDQSRCIACARCFAACPKNGNPHGPVEGSSATIS